MATWYYTKDGATFGPYAEETMADLISKGEVTFVTLVWNADTGNDGGNWLYAHDTPLAAFFADDSAKTAAANPPENAAEPEPAEPSGIPQQAPHEPEHATPSGAEGGDGSGKKPKKISTGVKIFLAIFLVGLLIGIAVASYILYFRHEPPQTAFPTEQALPQVAGDTIAFKLNDMSVPQSVVKGMKNAIAAVAPMPEGAERATAITPLTSALDGLGDLIKATEEMSLLAVPSENPGYYIALRVKGDAADLFMSRPGTFYTADKWDGNPGGGTGWIVRTPLIQNQLFVVKRPTADATSSIVLAASTEEAIKSMVSAADGASPAFSPSRLTNGADFMQLKLQNGITHRMIAESMPADSNLRQMWMKDPDKVFLAISETSWTKNGNIWDSETYSDLLDRNPELIAHRPQSATEPKLCGDGELAYFMAFDTGFMLNNTLPDTGNLIKEASKFLGPDTGATEAIASILEAGRVSLLCTEKERKAKTAYMLIETDAAESLDKMYKTYSPFTAMLGGVPAQIDGWDSAVSMAIPFRGGTSANIVLAHRKGALLAGFGDIGDFSKNLDVSGNYGNYLSKDNLMNVIVSSNIYDILLGMVENVPSGTAGTTAREMEAAVAGINAFRESFDSICGNLKPDGKAEGRIITTEGGDPIAAMFELFSRTAVLMPQRAAQQEEEATTIE